MPRSGAGSVPWEREQFAVLDKPPERKLTLE